MKPFLKARASYITLLARQRDALEAICQSKARGRKRLHNFISLSPGTQELRLAADGAAIACGDVHGRHVFFAEAGVPSPEHVFFGVRLPDAPLSIGSAPWQVRELLQAYRTFADGVLELPFLGGADARNKLVRVRSSFEQQFAKISKHIKREFADILFAALLALGRKKAPPEVAGRILSYV